MDAEPTVLAMLPVRIPAGTIDGSIVALAVKDGIVTAEICIPGPPVP
jgi:hypothetical protein